MTTTGSCMCGEVAYQFTGKPTVTALCHCTDCQKWTGGPCTSNVVVSQTDFSVTKGTAKTYDIEGASGKNNRHFFCGNCGSSLYTELEAMPGTTCIKAGGLDGGAASLGNEVVVEFYVKDRVTYLAPIAGANQEPAFGA
ncbi:hypothetical protein N3K66_000524 [Trichothecium roseum]|uniref:Uncharacterized protein n=1 Tax=Trichothecium roseum TaxID=47278 RepID=A0ACC0VE60_9HYPO|nr:hypothetical protein N3K66_000524 [Trichothecium roseum]